MTAPTIESEYPVGDKSPKAKQRDKNQKASAKVQAQKVKDVRNAPRASVSPKK